MSWSHEVRHPSKIVSVGAQVEAQVLNVDEAARKISLGMKQVAPNPWDLVETKYPIGTKIEGKVKSLTDFGAFVGLDERSEEHTSELQSLAYLVCRLLLEKKKKKLTY